jgi:hypothetical protein
MPDSRGARASTRRLVRAGVVTWSEDGVVLHEVGESRLSTRSCFPVPRRMLRWLCRCGTASDVATAMGHASRCLFYWSETKTVRSGGSCSAERVSDAYGVGERSVKRSRARLIEMGWLCRVADGKSGGRLGARFVVELDWASPESRLASQPSTKRRGLAPPYQVQNPPSGINKPKRDSGSLEEVCIQRVRPDDLNDDQRLLRLFELAADAGFVRRSEAGALAVFAAAERAKRCATRNPCGFFVTVIRKRLWHHVSGIDEERGRGRMRECPVSWGSSKGPRIEAMASNSATRSEIRAIVREAFGGSVEARRAEPRSDPHDDFTVLGRDRAHVSVGHLGAGPMPEPSSHCTDRASVARTKLCGTEVAKRVEASQSFGFLAEFYPELTPPLGNRIRAAMHDRLAQAGNKHQLPARSRVLSEIGSYVSPDEFRCLTVTFDSGLGTAKVVPIGIDLADTNQTDVTLAEAEANCQPYHRTMSRVACREDRLELGNGGQPFGSRRSTVRNVSRIPVPAEHLAAVLRSARPIDDDLNHLHSLRHLRRGIPLLDSPRIEALNVLHQQIGHAESGRCSASPDFAQVGEEISHVLSTVTENRICDRPTRSRSFISSDPSFEGVEKRRCDFEDGTWYGAGRLLEGIRCTGTVGRRRPRRSVRLAAVKIPGEPLVVGSPIAGVIQW